MDTVVVTAPLQLVATLRTLLHFLFVFVVYLVFIYRFKQNFGALLCLNKKAQLSLTNPRNACKKFARFT